MLLSTKHASLLRKEKFYCTGPRRKKIMKKIRLTDLIFFFLYNCSKIALTLKHPFTWATFSAQNTFDSDIGQTCLGFLGKSDTNRLVSSRDMLPKEAKVTVNTVQNCFNITTPIYMGKLFAQTNATMILVKLALAALGNLTHIVLFFLGTGCQRKLRQV
jgi:hypothetical protein